MRLRARHLRPIKGPRVNLRRFIPEPLLHEDFAVKLALVDPLAVGRTVQRSLLQGVAGWSRQGFAWRSGGEPPSAWQNGNSKTPWDWSKTLRAASGLFAPESLPRTLVIWTCCEPAAAKNADDMLTPRLTNATQRCLFLLRLPGLSATTAVPYMLRWGWCRRKNWG